MMRISTKIPAPRLLLCAAAALSAALLVAPAAAQAQTAPWAVVPSPNASPGDNGLNAVTSITASDVWAVGSAKNAIGNDQLLAEHWDGTAWTIIPTPSTEIGNLTGVAAVSSTDVWASGSLLLSSRGNTANFIHWNGRRWTVVKSPVANVTISGITAVSSNDVWAVGSAENQTTFNQQTLIEHWNGKTWSVVASPDASAQNNLLIGVTAVSASDIWAVGWFQNATNSNTHTLTEHWDGTAWSIVASPDGPGFESQLASATAVSASDVWAVGLSAGSGTLTEQWNGTSWSVVPSPTVTTSSELSGIAAVTASDIWATGITFTSSNVFQAFIEQWNGASWSIVPSPNPGSANFLSGAAADPVSGQAWAAGDFTPAAGSAQQTLTEFNP